MLGVYYAPIISISTDYNIAEIFRYPRLSWLSGKEVESIYAVPLGSFIRPLFFLIILWTFALDTLKDLYRAAKLGRPTHRLILAEVPSASPISKVPSVSGDHG